MTTSSGEGTADIPGWPEAFYSGNRLTFVREPTEADARWWAEKIFTSTGWLPIDLAGNLCAHMPGEASFRYEYIDGATQSFLVSAEGADAAGQIWMHATVLEINRSRFLLDKLKIDPRRRRQGVSRVLMRNVVEASRRLGIRVIRVDTEEDGGYHWASAGFVPIRGAWRDIRDYAVRQLPRLGLNFERQNHVLNLLVEADNSPELLWTIAHLTDLVPDPYSDTMARPTTTLGRALLVGAKWAGELNLEDQVQRARLEEWLAHGG